MKTSLYRLLCAAFLLVTVGYCESADELDPLDKNCKKSVFNEIEAGYMRGYECFYSKKTLMEVYRYFIDENIKRVPIRHGYAKLRRELKAGQNIDDPFDNDYLWINYKWRNEKALAVTIEYEGGETEWFFEQKEGGVEAVCQFYFQ